MKRGMAGLVMGLLAVIWLAACSGEGSISNPPGEEPIMTGSWVLRAVDGVSLPAVVFDGVVQDPAGDFHLRVEALEGMIELSDASTYQQRVIHSAYIDGLPTVGFRWVDFGSYLASGSTLMLDSGLYENRRFTASWRERGLDLVADYLEEGRPALYRYEKQ